MKIAFLMNSFDRTDTNRFPRSVGYYMIKHFEKQGAKVIPIQPVVTGEFLYKVKQSMYKYIFHKRHLRYTDLNLIKREAKIRSQIVNKSDVDIVFSFGPFASVFLETNKKIAWWTDAMFRGILNYYPEYSNLSQISIINNSLIDELGIKRADAAFFTSNWTLNNAIKVFPEGRNKYFIAPFGVNLDINHDIDFVKKAIEKRIQNDICKLLLVGVNWERKGADIAVEITKRLNEMGLKSELTVIGCKPDTKTILPDYVKIINFINTGTIEGMNLLSSYYEMANFFIFPTLAESYGHVLCEANAFGLPCISHNTGGIPSVIINEKNGQLFEIGENIDNWCNYIIKTFEDKNTYKELCLSSFNEYKTRLNWDNGCKIIIDNLQKLI